MIIPVAKFILMYDSVCIAAGDPCGSWVLESDMVGEAVEGYDGASVRDTIRALTHSGVLQRTRGEFRQQIRFTSAAQEVFEEILDKGDPLQASTERQLTKAYRNAFGVARLPETDHNDFAQRMRRRRLDKEGGK